MQTKACSVAVLGFVLTVFLPSVSQDDLRMPYPPPLPLPQQLERQHEERARMEKEMAKRANQARLAELKRDTEKLLKLATELKESVDKSNENTLSLDAVQRAEEIEKLAHRVKGKMKR
jgi:hypothetical protein